MVEPVKLEPTMEEIVVALRETRRGAGRTPNFAVVGREAGNGWARGNGTIGGGWYPDVRREADLIDIVDLRDGEIERLLTENARLNERIVFLLKVIEREQACNARISAERTAIEADQKVLGEQVRTVLQTELRPVMLLLLRILEKQRATAVGKEAAGTEHPATDPETQPQAQADPVPDENPTPLEETAEFAGDTQAQPEHG